MNNESGIKKTLFEQKYEELGQYIWSWLMKEPSRSIKTRETLIPFNLKPKEKQVKNPSSGCSFEWLFDTWIVMDRLLSGDVPPEDLTFQVYWVT